MGIIDTIKQFFGQSETSREGGTSIASVKEAANNQNYNQASIKAFYALETMGSAYAEQRRAEHETAREFAKKLVDEGLTTQEELEPILINFEIAKYSEDQVTFDDYSKVEQSLESIARKFKSGKVQTVSKTKGGKRKRRRKPKRGGKTGAAKTRKRRKRPSS